jgi:hypothetical protein
MLTFIILMSDESAAANGATTSRESSAERPIGLGALNKDTKVFTVTREDIERLWESRN